MKALKRSVLYFLLAGLTGFPGYVGAQQFDNRAWIYLSHSNKIAGPVSLFSELQFRSADKVEYLNTILLRGGLDYEIVKDKHKAGIGYVFKGDKEIPDQSAISEYTRENRIYEQYIFSAKTGTGQLQIRGRLEQRFIDDAEDDRIFSQRVRLLVSFQIPLNGEAEFNNGWFVVAQEEIMMTIQNYEMLSGSLFDQNRLYTSFGYRFNKNIDLELGYMYWLQQQAREFDHKNVYQVKITTDF